MTGKKIKSVESPQRLGETLRVEGARAQACVPVGENSRVDTRLLRMGIFSFLSFVLAMLGLGCCEGVSLVAASVGCSLAVGGLLLSRGTGSRAHGLQ